MSQGNLSFNAMLAVVLAFLAGALPSNLLAAGGSPAPAQVFDTSFAVEYEYSCLSGGCHETNVTLVNQHKQSYMTHIMVKCNTCHGTHTKTEVGKVKPNLTGYTASSGVTGYKVPKDRCLTCHSAALNLGGHPKNPGECLSCHAPHAFPRR
ncbi:MAG: hypothetical protein K8H84_08930 [Sulfuricella denitrificans]|nr:hypothetical protein [Sulfuricella denitrificans]